VLALLAAGRRRHALEVARFVPDCAVLFKRLLADPRVPCRARTALWLTLPYLASPIDLIPDFVPVVGQLDDALLVVVALRYVSRSAGRDLVAELWPGSEGGLRAVLALAK
jgi:uncharacterized membrane protein YkvA (DUF1232 family)